MLWHAPSYIYSKVGLWFSFWIRAYPCFAATPWYTSQYSTRWRPASRESRWAVLWRSTRLKSGTISRWVPKLLYFLVSFERWAPADGSYTIESWWPSFASSNCGLQFQHHHWITCNAQDTCGFAIKLWSVTKNIYQHTPSQTQADPFMTQDSNVRMFERIPLFYTQGLVFFGCNLNIIFLVAELVDGLGSSTGSEFHRHP